MARRPRFPRLSGLWASLGCLLLVPVAAVGAPGELPVHGVLTTSSGGAGPDGAYLLTFSLYASKDSKSALWSEVAKKAVKQGRFDHRLGSVKAIDDAAAQGALWLGVQVDTDPELPRVELGSVFFARRAAVAGKLQCSGCVTLSQLKFDGDVDLGGFALKASKVTSDSVVAKTVSAASYLGDGSKLVGVQVKGGSCPKGQAVTGVKPDGSVTCGAAGSDNETALGGMLTRKFVEILSATNVPRQIPDNLAFGTNTSVVFSDIGTPEAVQVRVKVDNTDLSQVVMKLQGPDGKELVLCDPCGAKDSKAYDQTLTDKSTLKSGSLAAYVGGSMKGEWKLTVVDKDFCKPQAPGNAALCDTNAKTDGAIGAFSVGGQVLSKQSVGTPGTFGVGAFDGPPFACSPGKQGHLYFDKKLFLMRWCDGMNWRESVPTTLCGNKIVNNGEGCDDGNTKDGDGCTSKCQKNVCGDGIVHKGVEECDNGNGKDGDGCTAKCKAEFSKVSFTTCGGTGRFGPSQQQCDTAYKNSDLAGNVKVNSGIQTWTVPATATYVIEAWGARSGYETPRGISHAGKGIGISGEFALQQGQVIKILVGQVGLNNTKSSSSAGGGGTFVATNDNKPLIVAGGGGGHEGSPRSSKQDASSGTSGQSGGGTCQNWCGGVDGKGATHHTGGNAGGGGGGFYTDGGKGSNGGTGGKAFVNGGAGGQALSNNVHGGFGGGGGAYGNGGGAAGGGGYSGGGLGDNCGGATAGGGGSFNGGAGNKTLGHHTGDGKVIISLK